MGIIGWDVTLKDAGAGRCPYATGRNIVFYGNSKTFETSRAIFRLRAGCKKGVDPVIG
jgi:hypothetical protein